jgi:hypothetical protein
MGTVDANVTQRCVSPLKTPTVTRNDQAPMMHISRAAPRRMGCTRVKPAAAAAASVTTAATPMPIALAIECANANVVTTMKPPASANASVR